MSISQHLPCHQRLKSLLRTSLNNGSSCLLYTICYNVRMAEISFTNKFICALMNYFAFSYVEMFRRSEGP